MTLNLTDICSEQVGESLSLKLFGLVRKYAMTYGTPGYIVYSFVNTAKKYTGYCCIPTQHVSTFIEKEADYFQGLKANHEADFVVQST